MIVALDIETVPNPEAVAMMPDPEVKTGNTKDPAKIAEKQAEAKAAQAEKAALDPLTARVASYAVVGDSEAGDGEKTFAEVLDGVADDEHERALIQPIMELLGQKDLRITTYNGIGFDMPMIYRRAAILGIDPGNFGAPPLTAWTKRYSTDRHWDLQQIWSGWDLSKAPKLETLTAMLLGEIRASIPYDQIPVLIQTPEGRKVLADGCVNHTRLTWQLWKRFNGVLFQ